MKILRLLLAAGRLPAARHVLGEPATDSPSATLTLTNPPSLAPAILLSKTHGDHYGRETKQLKQTKSVKKRLPFCAGLLAAMTTIGFFNVGKSQAAPVTSLFDGKTLDGWIDVENGATAFDGGSITNWPVFAKKLTDQSDAFSAFLNGRLNAIIRTSLAVYSPTNANAKTVQSALVDSLNRIVSGAAIYDQSRLQNVQLRPETQELLAKNPKGWELARLNKILIEDAYPGEMQRSSTMGWIVKDGVMASTGNDRGVIYTTNDFSHYRLLLTMRHVKGNPDHPAAVLFFCARPKDGAMPIDALGAIQSMIPQGYHWDYRPGHVGGGGPEFTTVGKAQINASQWSRVEILVDAAKGTARLAVAQPPGAKAVEILDYKLPEAGKTGPIALQMHNGGLFDEYKDITIEVDPTVDDLITTK